MLVSVETKPSLLVAVATTSASRPSPEIPRSASTTSPDAGTSTPSMVTVTDRTPLSGSSAVIASSKGSSTETTPEGIPLITGADSSVSGAPTYEIDGTGGSPIPAPMKYDGCGGWL